MNKRTTLAGFRTEIEKAGFTFSSASWDDGVVVYACSRETIGGPCGHPRFECRFNRSTGFGTVGKLHFSN